VSELLPVLLVLVGLVLSAVFSGSETGLYSLSRSRLDVEARGGVRGAALLRSLSERRATVLITLLIGNNVALEFMTLVAEHALEAAELSDWRRDALLTFGLTPVVFLFGELLPKDLFRRRPHTLMRLAAPVLLAARYLFWPLERVLHLVTRGLEALLGFEPEEIVRRSGRIELLGALAEGRAAGVVEPHAEELARNALRLGALPVTAAMIPWERVATVDAALEEGARRAQVEASRHTRMPVVEEGVVRGYVHQLGVLQAGAEVPVLEHLRPLSFLEPEVTVDRALAHLRSGGRRQAGVGTPEAPLGIVTLKDLVEQISGDLGGF
jgi:putative hemolysin